MNIMHTMASDARTSQVFKLRFYSPELKLLVVQTCRRQHRGDWFTQQRRTGTHCALITKECIVKHT